MRIACLQFAPQVGDTDNNLNRADAVLNKAKPEELEALDLLVLPEMAFSGYNFKSLQQIHPFLEPSGSGISSLWARTTALKFNTKVIVGYPEKVDVRHKWPASPEYYDSAIMVNGEGENVLNYRKRFLYKTDETWALEGNGGFYNGKIPGLGNTVVGICMDLNPYRFESPWNAFEFGFHALEVEPELIIVTMAWVTRQDNREFSRRLAEPDMETLTYWVQRLEPLISAELSKETVVVFCNRCGQEGDSLYAGTSAIIGIKGGEVNVYALAGRGTKEFLMADTSNPPFAKLIQGEAEPISPGLMTWPPTPSLLSPTPSGTATANTARNIAPSNGIAPPRCVPAPLPRIATSNQPRRDRPSPRIQIPDFGTHAFSGGIRRMGTVSESPNTIPTPEAPSPTPLALRPKLIIPEPEIAFGDSRKPSPYPHDDFLSQQFRFFGRQHQPFTPVPPEEDPAQARYYWRPSDTLLNTPLDFTSAFSPDADSGPKINDLGPLTPYPGSDIPVLFRRPRHDVKAREAAKAQPVTTEQPKTSCRAQLHSPAITRLVPHGRRTLLSTASNPPRTTAAVEHLYHPVGSARRLQMAEKPVTQNATEESGSEVAGDVLPKLPNPVDSPGCTSDEARPISRGRPRWSARDPPPPYSETENNRLVVHVQLKQPPKQAPSANPPLVPRQVSITRMQSSSGLVGIRFATPDDEIIAIEEYIDPVCNMHSKRSASASAISHKIPSIEDGRAIVGMRAKLPPPPPVAVLDLTDDAPDRRVTVFRTPSVLGGSVKTTVIDLPPLYTGSGVSVLTPPLSAVFEMMSPTSPDFQTSGNNTPFAPNFHQTFDLTPRAMAVVQQFASIAKRIDTPFSPLACIDCDHEKSVDKPLKTGPLERVKFVEEDMPKALLSGLGVTPLLRKRRSW
ncbi:Carbon-nitrogen hydrolase [Coniochaeta hoffmannii]|uniref:Carbon-nitrogen hydrolase n=1 Tax=Coniochaeta hoffmannii TaxID=91930 RepID=A0AA38VZB2_9PEZI|nr:Carbon-nitrogen hydrolase [Coniochaeta hoffmannii]